MTVDEEQLIERYVRGSGTFSDEDRSRAETLAASDPAARDLLVFFRRYYSSLQETEEPDLRRIIDRIEYLSSLHR